MSPVLVASAQQMPDTLAMFGVLPGRHIHPVLVRNGRGVDFTWTLSSRITDRFAVLHLVFGRIAIGFPHNLQESRVVTLYRLGIERIAPAVTAAEKHKVFAIDLRRGGRAPLAVIDLRANASIVFGDEFAGLFVQGNEAGRVGVWNKKGEFLFELEGHEQYINSISFNHDGSLIATTSADESARVWDASNGKSLFTMKGPKGDFRYADFSSDDRYIVTSNQNNAAWVWDRIAKKSVIQLVGSNNAINVAKFGPDGKLILAGSQDQHAYLYNCEVCDSPQNLLELARKRVTRPLRPEEQETYSR